jgi:hypothetical protein
MSRVRLLHGIYRKRANRVDAQLIELGSGGDRLVTDCHQFSPRNSLVFPTTNLDEISPEWIHVRQLPQVYIGIEKENEARED